MKTKSIPGEKVFQLAFSLNSGRQRIPSLFLSPAAPSEVVAALFRLVFCFEWLSKTAGPLVLHMELQINLQLMVSAVQTKARFLSRVAEHFYSS